jgi:hypothetical protein
MDNFWTWLRRANARTVFLCALAGLVAVLVWWTGKALMPIELRTPIVPAAQAEKTRANLGLLAFLAGQTNTSRPQNNPFFNPHAFQPGPLEVAVVAPTQPQVSPPVTTVSVSPPPPPKNNAISLTYRGMMTRSDGVIMALVEDSKSKLAAFYSADTNLFGMTIEKVTGEELVIGGTNRPTLTLKRGTPESLREAPHAD